MVSPTDSVPVGGSEDESRHSPAIAVFHILFAV
jgi:hypothetical protein